MDNKVKKSKTNAKNAKKSSTDFDETVTRANDKLTKDLIDAIADNDISPNAKFPFSILSIVIEAARQLLLDLVEHWHGQALTTNERRRLRGSGVRRYGFIDKMSDIATDNPEFTPRYLDLADLKELIRRIEMLRDVDIVLRQAQRLNMDYLLTTGSEAYRLSLMYYNAVREAARMRVPGAQELFNVMKPFFAMSPVKHDEPTEAEVERHVRALMHGKAEGEIVIKNEADKVVKGNRTVIDDVHKPAKMKIKETESEEIDE